MQKYGCDLSSDDNCVGSTLSEITLGTKNYLNDHNHSAYIALKASMTNDYDDYTGLIALGNPAILTIYNSTYGNHSVLGLGFYTAYGGVHGILIYDDWDHGDVWISPSIVTNYIFIYDI
jgi:hypothetical protein